jgi:hypothetical protein
MLRVLVSRGRGADVCWRLRGAGSVGGLGLAIQGGFRGGCPARVPIKTTARRPDHSECTRRGCFYGRPITGPKSLVWGGSDGRPARSATVDRDGIGLPGGGRASGAVTRIVRRTPHPHFLLAGFRRPVALPGASGVPRFFRLGRHMPESRAGATGMANARAWQDG